MLCAISALLVLGAAVNVLGTRRIWYHFIPKDVVKWFHTIVELMFKAFATFLFER
jgi:hypothetical protein